MFATITAWGKTVYGWVAKWFGLKRGEVVMLRNENAALAAKIKILETEILKLRVEKHQAEQKVAEIEKLHEERIVVCLGMEFRKGRRIGNMWAAFCPNCHVPLHPRRGHRGGVTCPASCGWSSPISEDEICEGIDEINTSEPSAPDKKELM